MDNNLNMNNNIIINLSTLTNNNDAVTKNPINSQKVATKIMLIMYWTDQIYLLVQMLEIHL